jgi:spore maturation protein CgeB
VDRRADLEQWFSINDEVLVFDDALQLRRIVEDALQDLTAVERIASAGRERVLAEHTYMHRLRELLRNELSWEVGGSGPAAGAGEVEQSAS